MADFRRIERLAAEMALTFNWISLYQAGHPSLAGREEKFHRNLADVLNGEPSGHLLLGVAKDKFLYLHHRVQSEAERLCGLNIGFFRDHVVVDEFPFVEPNPTLTRRIERMREKGIEKILISEGITFGELKRFVHFLAEGTCSPSEHVWESIVYGRIEGTESAGAVSLGLAPASRPAVHRTGTDPVDHERGRGTEFEPRLFDDFVGILSSDDARRDNRRLLLKEGLGDIA